MAESILAIPSSFLFDWPVVVCTHFRGIIFYFSGAVTQTGIVSHRLSSLHCTSLLAVFHKAIYLVSYLLIELCCCIIHQMLL